MKSNPYLILHIDENATDEEIKQARLEQLKLQCGNDENRKNEQNEYLQEVIIQAANDLLDPIKRKEIDESLQKQLPISYDATYQLPVLASITQTKINEEFVRQIPPAKLTRKFFAKKVKCKDLFIVVSSDYNVVYATQNCDAEEKCYLSEYFTKTYITWSYACDECPWDRAQVFDSLGLLAYAYPAYQLLPLSIIQDGKVTEEMLRVLHPIIKEAFCNQKEDLSKYFVEEQVNQKVKKKKKK